MNESDLNALFNAPESYEDNDAFERRVMGRLQAKLWFRQGLVVLAGFVGGLYALAQFVRLPNWTLDGKTVYAAAAHKAVVESDQTWRAGAQLMDLLHAQFLNLTQSSAQYLVWMQTPVFFWLSFSLCLAFVGLYYAYSQEETL